MTPKRIRLQRTKGWRMPADTIKVDRTGRFGNPWKVERLAGQQRTGDSDRTWHDRWECRHVDQVRGRIFKTKREAAAFAVEQFRIHVLPTIDIAPLVGMNIGCWCHLGEPCHGDTLLAAAIGYAKA